MLKDLLEEPVRVKINGRERELPFTVAYVQMTKQMALAGDAKARRTIDGWFADIDFMATETLPMLVKHTIRFV